MFEKKKCIYFLGIRPPLTNLFVFLLRTGGLCETENNSCYSNPCPRNSICEPQLQGSYACNCLPGHKGNSCEICKYRLQLAAL